MAEGLKIGLVNALNPKKKTAMNKELNGGYGTCDDYGNSFSSKIIKFVKKKSIRLPLISFAFLQAIFKNKGYDVKFFEDELPKKDNDFDLILIYGSIVDYKNENSTCELLKKRFPNSKIGFIGPFPSIKPELFKSGDFVIIGEAEAFFMNDFKNLEQLNGKVDASSQTDMDTLPTPDFDGFNIKEYGYEPAISKRPFLVLQASKGCPYSCGYYCTYGAYQGPKIRQRSAKKVVEDILILQKKYDARGIQFRDPTFGLNKNWMNEFCEELKKENVKVDWGMETRLDLLSEENVKKMFDVGLRNLNIGIETSDLGVAKRNKRKLVEFEHQGKMIKFCKNLGVNVSAFYIFGLEGDTEKTIKETMNYAIKMNTLLARFSVSTPYPGTSFYNQLKKEERLLTDNFEEYTQFNLVYKHENLSPECVRKLLERAMRKYYFRPSYAPNLIKNKIMSFL